jgi:hypothetical protein
MSNAGSEFQIRAHSLDKEWLSQPEIVHEYCTRMADAKRQLNDAKATLELVEAESDREIRLHPSRYGIDKLSEARIKNAVVLTESYREAYKELIERQHEHDVLQAAVTALEHKKRALENLVHLHGMDYFAEPRADAEAMEASRESRRDAALRSNKKRGGRHGG